MQTAIRQRIRLPAAPKEVDDGQQNHGAVTQLAEQRTVPFRIDEFRTLNRCLDNAIADAVSEFSSQRDSAVAERLSTQANERLAFLAHELRNSLQVANLSVRAMELGGLALGGATGAVLKRSLASMRALVDTSIGEVRARSAAPVSRAIFSLSSFIADAGTAARLEADVRGCALIIATVDPVLRVEANRDLLLGALGNPLGNAFKFTHRATAVHLRAYDVDDRIHIDVEDRCGGLASKHQETMFTPFIQLSADRSGLGLGLSIARQNVEAMGGKVSVRDLPELGCVFTISFPKSTAERRSDYAPLT